MPHDCSFPLPRRRLLQAAALAAGVPAAGAAPAAEPAPLQITGPWEINGLAPATSGYLFLRMQVAETLVGAADDGTPAPALAERWSVSADGRDWRFVLRPGARFHDGTPVTAAAVVRCLDAARVAPALLSAAPLRAVEADGPRTVVLRLDRPHGALLARLAHSSTIVLAPSSYRPDGRVAAIVGSGPYRVTALAAPQRVETAVFDGFDGPPPAVRQVRYLTASRAETRALMAESGQADLAYGLDPVSLQRLRRRPQLRIASVTLPRTALVKVNAGHPALRDPRVRQALSLAIDRTGIARALLREPDLAATQLLPPVLAGWHDPALAPLGFDTAGARRLLEEAGWRPAGGDHIAGLLGPGGTPLELTLRTFVDRPELPVIAAALQEQWRQAGVAVRVAIGNSGDVPLGHRDGSLQLALIARNYATVPDPTGTLAQDFGPQGGDWGAMGWHDDRVIAALRTLAGAPLPPGQVQALRRQVAAVLQAELPLIPVAWYRQQVAVSQRLQDVSLDPLERSYRLDRMRWSAA
ncbi:ABC transporter substrate-binding protein [uncultured Xylophilus sp.]|uniref:ABC transporter substrate-binding protein n=1 Tax=uncultured Xylophilus sp. TaxID=296832 RepID=UPI0025D81D6A|nr:ABC transporter substrate-binding protein [uncultured Xylophilus sp.]